MNNINETTINDSSMKTLSDITTPTSYKVIPDNLLNKQLTQYLIVANLVFLLFSIHKMTRKSRSIVKVTVMTRVEKCIDIDTNIPSTNITPSTNIVQGINCKNKVYEYVVHLRYNGRESNPILMDTRLWNVSDIVEVFIDKNNNIYLLDNDHKEKGKKYITYSLIGFVVLYYIYNN